MKGDANHRLKVDVQRIELRKIGESMERRHRFVFSLLEELYDRLQDYLRVADSDLPEDLVKAMDGLEAAWHRADSTVLEDDHGKAA